ncbi:hypothetical protein JCM33374_g6330 [Metschnikowia sp. JCM 33374]|nr:hypothetical protein JCM33374_g6330 [Metschnikowia sp. JCM 33374]
MSRDSVHSPETSAALRRLLSSHHSVYNTLTDPLLECTSPSPSPPRSPTKERASTQSEEPTTEANEGKPQNFQNNSLEDSFGSFSSWQPINLSSINGMARSMRISSPFAYNGSRPASASILSNSTDDEFHPESLVLVPSLRKQIAPSVLLFETDEEDDADEDVPFAESRTNTKAALDDGRPTITSSNSQAHVSGRTDSSQTFIMPKLLLSEEIETYQLTIVSSMNKSLDEEIKFLIDFIQQNLDSPSYRLSITHIPLAKPPSLEEISLSRNSNLLLAINDGCVWLSVLIGSIVGGHTGREMLPDFAVVNLLTSNYFANLFDIIRNLRPHQCIKSPSLKDNACLSKIKLLIEKELNKDKATAKLYSHEVQKNNSHVYESHPSCRGLSESIEKTDYKKMEKTIRHEMVFSPEFHSVDPLCLSSSLSRFSILATSLGEYFEFRTSDINPTMFSVLHRETLWFFCSFSVGIGLGFTLNALQVFKMLRSTLFVSASPSPVPALKPSSRELYINLIAQRISKVSEHVTTRLDDFSTRMIEIFAAWGITNFENMGSAMKTATTIAFDLAMSGLSRIGYLIQVWIE